MIQKKGNREFRRLEEAIASIRFAFCFALSSFYSPTSSKYRLLVLKGRNYWVTVTSSSTRSAFFWRNQTITRDQSLQKLKKHRGDGLLFKYFNGKRLSVLFRMEHVLHLKILSGHFVGKLFTSFPPARQPQDRLQCFKGDIGIEKRTSKDILWKQTFSSNTVKTNDNSFGEWVKFTPKFAGWLGRNDLNYISTYDHHFIHQFWPFIQLLCWNKVVFLLVEKCDKQKYNLQKTAPNILFIDMI